ncbi:hypothetical protein [Desulfosediminicola ganghwensis]|uniref:hypothetical protein n=1 Tax=Desulfosediminicola ganghwensis TaxID=2569540 RepID=UPI0010AC55FF|nr:hypothetical protein [Desulfosediminicola ganghwensis]
MQTEAPRLDILIYAHDGRGLGHVSRSAAIGMAIRRLYPELKVLLVTGASLTQDLIGDRHLDWLKLPSYATEVVDGVSRGIAGSSGFEDSELGTLRSRQLLQVVELYRPRVVLADHTPQGKHRELLPAMQHSSVKIGGKTRWVLGVRGVVGGVAQAGSETARATFEVYYQNLLWYGDSGVLGQDHLRLLENFYKVVPNECGYVARLREVSANTAADARASGLAATVSIPWLGENTGHFARQLAQAINTLGDEYGAWNIFCDPQTRSVFSSIPRCQVFSFSGAAYVNSLKASRAAVIFGGYNSVVDALSLGIPALVIMREMADREQQIHLERLSGSVGEKLQALDESRATTALLQNTLKRIFQLSNPKKACRPGIIPDGVATNGLTQFRTAINLNGAENAAMNLKQLVKEQALR